MRPTLTEIVDNKKREIAERKQTRPLSKFDQQAETRERTFVAAVTAKEVNLIAELKPKSPSAGVLREGAALDAHTIAGIYNKYAAAISVLADEKYFGGSIALMQNIASQVAVPVLCKDFIIDHYQIYEAREAGAQAILLIAKILDDSSIDTLQKTSRMLGMTPVIEIQNEMELERVLPMNPDILLINNRDLSTFETSLTTTERLSPLIPPGLPFISASGIESAADIQRLLPHTRTFLVGSSIMRATNVEAKLQELCGGSATCEG